VESWIVFADETAAPSPDSPHFAAPFNSVLSRAPAFPKVGVFTLPAFFQDFIFNRLECRPT
jgi:hypothetical protein